MGFFAFLPQEGPELMRQLCKSLVLNEYLDTTPGFTRYTQHAKHLGATQKQTQMADSGSVISLVAGVCTKNSQKVCVVSGYSEAAFS